MAIDDNPIEALRKQFDLEDLSRSPVSDAVIKVTTEVAKILALPPSLKPIIQTIGDKIRTDGIERISIMLKTVADEVLKHDQEIRKMKEALSSQQVTEREEKEAALVIDGARRAFVTRSIAKVQRIGIILARTISAPASPDEDEIEEMMRIASELAEADIAYLGDLVKVQGQFLAHRPYIERYTAYQSWEGGPWGSRVDPTLDSVFHKLESYGLVSAIAPNNTLNITADIQTRFSLLPKGLRFFRLIRS
jgi:hypothetical protein